MAAPMINNLTSKLSRLSVTARTASSSLQLNRCVKTQASPLLFLKTDRLQKKTMSQFESKRLFKQKKKLEKLLEKMDRTMKLIKAPIKEHMVEMKIEKEAGTIRKRELSVPSEEREKEIKKFFKEWEPYCTDFSTNNIHFIQRRLLSQQMALEELREESEELYQKAIAIDEDLYDFSVKRLTETPAIPGFQAIDGEYNDVTIKYD